MLSKDKLTKEVIKDFESVKQIYLEETFIPYAEHIAVRHLIRLMDYSSYDAFVNNFTDIPLDRCNELLQSMLGLKELAFYGHHHNYEKAKEYIKVYGPTITSCDRTIRGYLESKLWHKVESHAEIEFNKVKDKVLGIRQTVVHMRAAGLVEKGKKPCVTHTLDNLEDIVIFTKHRNLITNLSKVNLTLQVSKETLFSLDLKND